MEGGRETNNLYRGKQTQALQTPSQPGASCLTAVFEGMVALFVFFFFFFNKFIYLFIFAVLGLRFCARAFSSCSERGPLFIAVRGPLTIAASVVAEHRLQTRRLSSCDSRAQLLRGMWDLPRPGLEPVSPALAGRFSTIAPPGKPCLYSFEEIYLKVKHFILVNPLAKQIEPKLTKSLFRTELKANCVSFLF